MITNREMIYDIIQDTLNVSREAVTKIVRTPDGETNDSYFVTVKEEKYVVRLPGKGTDKLVNRHVEKLNILYCTKLGLHPEVIYFNERSGVKMTRKIKGATPIRPSSVKSSGLLKDIIHLFQHLHQTKTPMANRFDLFAMIDHYESLVRAENSMAIKKVNQIKLAVKELKQIYLTFDVKEAPCHIDAACSNILKDTNGRLYLIDMEYSGMFDPLIDIATLVLSLNLNAEETSFFLTYYFGCQPTNEEIQRLHLLKIFLDYNWGLWYFYKEAKGDDFGTKGIDRMERAKQNITLYNMLYDEGQVS